MRVARVAATATAALLLAGCTSPTLAAPVAATAPNPAAVRHRATAAHRVTRSLHRHKRPVPHHKAHHAATPLLPVPVGGGAQQWAAGRFATAVRRCESSDNPRAVNGKYRGLWQMDAGFWRTYGGLAYAARPDLATRAQQNEVAWRGWKVRGWEPWTCSRLVT